MNIEGKISLITGGSRRVGKEIALELAKGGSFICIHYRNSRDEALKTLEEIRKLGSDGEIFSADLRKPHEIKEVFEKLREKYGVLHILINNAAVFKRTPFHTLNIEDFDLHIETNLRAPYLCSIEGKKLMKEGGKIINIVDIKGMRPTRNYLPYSISKAGLIMMTKDLARLLAPEIQVNAVAAGVVLLREDENVEEMEKIIRKIPLGRTGSPEDIAKTVRFLIEGSDYITGQVIVVDGGMLLC